MEDFKLILYVLAAVAYFVFMQWRKAFNNPKDDVSSEAPKPERRPLHPNRPATSFEDILRELQPKVEKAKETGRNVAEKTKDVAKPIVTPPTPVAESKPKYRNYEDRAPKALSWEVPAEARLAAKQSEERRLVKRIESAEREQASMSRYAKLLRNPASARDAIILTEIFNRKYN